MIKKILTLPAVISLAAGLALGSTAHYLFNSDVELRASESDDFIQRDYIKLLQEKNQILERTVELHEENRLVRDEADKLAGLIEQYQMELSRFIEE